jgi:hypothetical protein
MRFVALLGAAAIAVPAALAGGGGEPRQPQAIITPRELISHAIGLENEALEAKNPERFRSLVREASENLETAVNELKRATGSVDVGYGLKAAQTALERDERALKEYRDLKFAKGLVELALTQKKHAGSELVGAGVKVRLTARFIEAARETRYTVEIEDAVSTAIRTYRWRLSPPLDDPTCKKFRKNKKHPDEADWFHSAADGCSHATPQHDGTVYVSVVVGVHWICEASIFGTETTPAQGHDLEFCRLR